MNKTSGGKLAGSATPNPESNNKYNHRPTMKTKPNFLIILLSISIILLTWADRAAAAGRTIIVDGSGVTVTVSLDGQSCALDLGETDRATGASFDRFGICTPWIDGNSVTVYFDDLQYTASQPGRIRNVVPARE